MTTTPQDDALNPRCVATTGDTFCKAALDSQAELPNDGRKRPASNLFREAQFSGDGTTIVTQSEDHCLRAFLLPVDLLDESKQPHPLSASCVIPSPTSVYSYALYPYFDLQHPSTTLALYAAKDVPISLSNVIHSGTVHATYPLIHTTTEAYISPNSLAWTRDGSKFVAGSMNQISVFDAKLNGSGPALQHKTGPGKTMQSRIGSLNPHSCSGMFTALSIGCDGMLAAGTRERHVALYANEGSGECTTSFSLSPRGDERDTIKGSGVTQLAWSPCGTYLFIAERQSNGIQVYDVRNVFERMACLSGRQARTPQRLNFDIVPAADGFELWAGGTDGCVQMWRNPGSLADAHFPDETLRLHDDAVSSTIWHPRGAVMATCSGRRLFGKYSGKGDSSSESEDPCILPDNTLKVWTV